MIDLEYSILLKATNLNTLMRAYFISDNQCHFISYGEKKWKLQVFPSSLITHLVRISVNEFVASPLRSFLFSLLYE